MTNLSDPTPAEERVARHLAAKDWLVDADQAWMRRGTKFRDDYLKLAREVIALVREEPAAVSAAVAPPTDPTHGLSVQHADALWDAVAIPGPRTPTYPEQHERVCRAVARIIDDITAGQTTGDPAAVLREQAERLSTKANQLTENLHNLAYFVAKDRMREAEILDREATELRRMADETATQTPAAQTVVSREARDDQCAWCGAPLHDETEEWITLTIRSEEWALCRECGESPDTMGRLIRHITHNDEQPAAARQDEPAPGSTQPRPCRAFVSGSAVWCCEEGEADCPCVCHQPAAGARQDKDR